MLLGIRYEEKTLRRNGAVEVILATEEEATVDGGGGRLGWG